MTGPKYIRPAPPDLGELAKTTARLRATNDRHAATMGPEVRRPLAASQLAPAIARDNEARRDRQLERELQDSAAEELRLAATIMIERIEEDGAIDAAAVKMYLQGSLEFFGMLGSSRNTPARQDRVADMNAAIESLKARLGKDWGAP